MAGLILKPYQDRALDALDTFLDVAGTNNHVAAYDAACVVGDPGQYRRAYTPFVGLPDTPWACLRLPTGGGKTLLASHAVGIAHRRSMQNARYPVVLWLVTSTTIADQTLVALKTSGHPYRIALDDAFGGAVRAIGIDERRALKPQDLATAATVIVATVQSFRVTNAAGRKVYQDDEEYEGFFKGKTLPEGLMTNPADARVRPGETAWSFANLMAVMRPILIVDEAHNFTSDLSGETLARLRPQAIVEFTATPLASNVIASATAAELKAAEMIKLPIHLVQHGDWQTTILHAMQRRDALAALAISAKEPIRPIALYQAAANRPGAEGTVEAVKTLLLQHGVDAETIKVATGTQRELDGIDLFDPACVVTHIITVEALREGWDCSFAYVFASVANIRSATAVEQLLGRVLRMPFAQRRPTEALNHAYAFATGLGFHDAANALHDRLIAMGFDEQAAREAIVADHAAAATIGLPGLEPGPAIPPIRVPTMPDFGLFDQAMRAATTVRESATGGYTVELADDAAPEVLSAVADIIATIPGAEDARPAVVAHNARRLARRTASERGEVMTIPALALGHGGQAELIWPDTLLDLAGWTLDGIDPNLPGFALTETPEVLVFDIANGRVEFRKDDPQLDFALGAVGPWDAATLSRWLDAETRQIDAPAAVYLEYCRRVVTYFVATRGFDLASLIRGKQALKRAIETRVKALRADAGGRGLQLLMTDVAPILDLGENAFRFEAGRYSPPRLHPAGGWQPQRHFFPRMGEMNGEEVLCARAIDEMDGVKHWVRNVEKQPESFWLPTATDRFYPDFVAEMENGGWLVIEYKGGHIASGDDTAEKTNIGLRWADVSAGKGRFWMAEKSKAPDFRQRLAAAVTS
jgi:type III restriction enzyme